MTTDLSSAAGGKRVLALVTDAYGGYGGVAAYSRDVLRALCEHPGVERVVALPRSAAPPLQQMPADLDFDLSATGGAAAYLRSTLRHLRRSGPFDLIYCAHIHLAPLAWAASKLTGAPWALCLYGIDAWKRTGRPLTDRVAGRADHYIPLSRLTLERFLKVWPVDPARCTVMHNAIHLDAFAPGPKDEALSARLGLSGRTVLMTFGRLDPTEQAKGNDRVIRLLPRLAAKVPDVAYLICGKGGDRPRLERIAAECGVADRVVFAGAVPEEEKAAHYRLADVYVMPSVGEGFGFVFLEAMACGIPAVASDVDGGREAVLEGEIGWLCDPHDPDSIEQAVLAALAAGRGVPDKLSVFAWPSFRTRLQNALGPLMGLAPVEAAG